MEIAAALLRTLMSRDRRRDGLYSSLFPFACCTALSGATWYLSRVVWRDHVDAVQARAARPHGPRGARWRVLSE